MLLKYKIIFGLCLFTSIHYGQDSRSESFNEGINIGHTDSLYSDILNEKRELLIYLPESLQYSDYKREKYPVLYLLDGRYNFLQLVALVRQYAEKNDSKIVPEMIVVGISNENQEKRHYDYSPSQAGNLKRYGGGDKFLEFFRKELFPYIESRYPAARQSRTIIGHSFGGVVVLNALSRYPEMFKNYVLIDGSIWYDNELFLKDPKFNLEGKKLTDKNLFIGIANTSHYGSNLNSIKEDTLSVNKYIRHSLAVKNQAEKSPIGPNIMWEYYEKDSHGSSVFPSQRDALLFFFSWFDFDKERKYFGRYNLPKSEDESFSNLTEKHFKRVSEKLGYAFYPTAPWFISKSNMLMNFQNLPNQAKELLELAEQYYPGNKVIIEKLKALNQQ